MNAGEKATVVSIRTPDDILATVPVLLGFHPTDSVVFVGLHGEQKRAGLTARLDLRDYLADPARNVNRMADMYDRNDIADVLVVFYGHEPDLDVRQLFVEHGVAVLDVLAASNEPHVLLPALVEQNALHGRSVLPNREALVNSVAFREDAQADNLDALLAVMSDVAERDRFITVALEQRKQVLPLLITACQATGDDLGEVACNLLATTAIAAYRAGDGALALEALQRSEHVDREHALSALLMTVITAGVPPEFLDDLMLGADQEVVARYPGGHLLERWAVAAGVPL